MHDHTGYLLGQLHEQMADTKRRLNRLEASMSEVQTLLRRAVLLLSLWGSALILILSNERAAEAVITVIRLAKGS